MAKITSVTQHAEAARLGPHDLARILVAGLGPTLVAAMTGSKDRKLPSKWARPDGPEPGDDFQRRLQFGHRAWTALVLNENEHVARAWFIGGNPLLGEATPITAIREDRGADVMRAVDAFLAGYQDV
ncbi:hypothetical protein [Leifsonia sp. SIMBA_070]|uniref:hypothetical protein n=1 Tax=Leifsonia sp. SIMBA_070 TaxID=3085810 RepID=UPI00397B6805